MFEDIKKDKNRVPVLTYYLAIVATLITVLTIIFPNLYGVFGSTEGDISILKIFTVPFQHGFDRISAVALLILTLYFWITIGGFVEKVMGPDRFTLLVTTTVVLYALTEYLTGQPGHGLTPFVYAVIPVLFAIMSEVVDIKIGNSYDKHYRYLRMISGLFVLISVVFHSFFPVYFSYDKLQAEAIYEEEPSQIAFSGFNLKFENTLINLNFTPNLLAPSGEKYKPKRGAKTPVRGIDDSNTFSSIIKGVIFGNLLHLVGLFVGIGFAHKLKKRMGGTLTRYSKRKELSEKSYRSANIFMVFMSLYLLSIFALSFVIEF